MKATRQNSQQQCDEEAGKGESVQDNNNNNVARDDDGDSCQSARELLVSARWKHNVSSLVCYSASARLTDLISLLS